MATLRLIMGDQLSHGLSALQDRQDDDVVLMAELREEATYVKHHPQKIVLILSAMRHFAAELRDKGTRVDYVALTDPDNSGTFTGEVERALARHSIDRIVVTHPGEWRVLSMLQDWPDRFGIPVEIRPDDRFLSALDEFSTWATGRKSYRMEFFYREMRRKTGWLMQDDEPMGGQWNFDADNREPLPDDLALPRRQRFSPDDITREIMQLVEERFSTHFGDIENFAWAVTRADALQALHHFIDECLPRFGQYQDAMKQDQPLLFHSLLSPYLNIGLLEAREVCAAALAAYDAGNAALASVEGFIRQILGWREYVRGLYWLRMPDYADSNFLEARRPLPALYWGADTDLNCLRQAVASTREHAYAHHIQRLMITGNFALLIGVEPHELEQWYLAVYADAFDWVELPNTHGMVAFADGGLLASKPYAASGAYIHRMSDYCAHCHYNVKEKQGAQACPFNYLYWDFLIRNRARLGDNPRLAMPYRNLDKMPEQRLAEIRRDATEFLSRLD